MKKKVSSNSTITANDTPFGKLNADCMIRILSFLPVNQLVQLSVLSCSYCRLIQTTAQFYANIEFYADVDVLRRSCQFNWITSVSKYVKHFSINLVDILAEDSKPQVLTTIYKGVEHILTHMPNLDSFCYYVMLESPAVH